MCKLKGYRFVLFFSNTDYNKVVYSDFEKMDCVSLYRDFRPSNNILKALHKVHFSEKINTVYRLPFKSIWYKKLFSLEKLDKSQPLCFLFMYSFANDLRIIEFIEYLKKHFPKAKFVCYYTDIISSLSPQAIVRDVVLMRKYFDLLISYDKDDETKYCLSFFPTSFSDYKVDEELTIPQKDILFLGAAKDRWNKILNTYKYATSCGLECDFYIYKLPKEKEVNHPGIHYIKTPMPYKEYLKHVVRSRCVLEIEQGSATGSTLRNWEAINYDKYLLTDNSAIKTSPFYDEGYVRLVNPDGTFDSGRISQEYGKGNPLKETIRPVRLLEFIVGELEREKAC